MKKIIKEKEAGTTEKKTRFEELRNAGERRNVAIHIGKMSKINSTTISKSMALVWQDKILIYSPLTSSFLRRIILKMDFCFRRLADACEDEKQTGNKLLCIK